MAMKLPSMKKRQVERVKQVKEKDLSVLRYEEYMPIGNVVNKLNNWVNQGAEIVYLSSHENNGGVEKDKIVLNKYNFPKGEIYFRKGRQTYKDIAEKIMPDILIEDDCESIGGKKEMTYTHINPKAKERIKLISVREFEGIDNLPDNLEELQKYIYLINKGTKVKVPA